MKVFKALSRWWDDTHGGEWKIHIDFAVEPDESLREGIIKAIESCPDDAFWDSVRPDGNYYKIHLTASIHCDDGLLK